METAVRFLKVQSWFIEKLLKKGKAKKIFEKGGHKIWLLLGQTTEKSRLVFQASFCGLLNLESF